MIKERLSALKQKIIHRSILIYDYNRYIKNCCDSNIKNKKKKLEREILITCHTIEKGLSHKNIRQEFAKSKVKLLYKDILRYGLYTDKDMYIYRLAVSSLRNYYIVAEKLGYTTIINRKDINKLECDKNVDVGAIEINEREFFKGRKGCFTEIVFNRRSMRLYDIKSENIDKSIIKNCVEKAIQSPSACNRQAVRVYAITEEEKIKQIVKIQKGSNGFGDNCGSMLLITVDLNYYNIHERRLPMFDSGLFTMTLVYSLYEQNIGTCILNGSFLPVQEKELDKIIKLPKNEELATIIALNKVPFNETVRIAKSSHRDVSQVLRFE